MTRITKWFHKPALENFVNDDQFITLWNEAYNNGHGVLWIAGELGIKHAGVRDRAHRLRDNGVYLPDMRHVSGKLIAATTKLRYGNQFYVNIGTLGGRKSRGGGFASNPELAREAGRLGGMTSRRGRNA